MLLAIDAGNTNVVFALVDDGDIRARWRIATDPRRTADEYVVWLNQLLELEELDREAVTAVIVLRPDAPTDDEAVAKVTAEIQSAVKDRKGSVQSPKQVIVVDSVPVTALGKPDKKAVRAQFWEGAGRAVG